MHASNMPSASLLLPSTGERITNRSNYTHFLAATCCCGYKLQFPCNFLSPVKKRAGQKFIIQSRLSAAADHVGRLANGAFCLRQQFVGNIQINKIINNFARPGKHVEHVAVAAAAAALQQLVVINSQTKL